MKTLVYFIIYLIANTIVVQTSSVYKNTTASSCILDCSSSQELITLNSDFSTK